VLTALFRGTTVFVRAIELGSGGRRSNLEDKIYRLEAKDAKDKD